jgi:hypothetical protein
VQFPELGVMGLWRALVVTVPATVTVLVLVSSMALTLVTASRARMMTVSARMPLLTAALMLIPLHRLVLLSSLPMAMCRRVRVVLASPLLLRVHTVK